ncbi:MAG: thioredoxin domain-containing protein, partial [bacterium]
IEEKSPYLLQHAFNPVDWYPWGQAAFDRAKAENKPIFLSVGYSTCHWCHVMEHESFENPEVAAVMNNYFVSIKVDREERPDVDRVYMAAVQGLTGSGGWPMSVFLTPELKPFFGGTYYPPHGKYGRPGFVDIMERIHDAWTTQHGNIIESADQITAALQKQLAGASSSDTLAVSALDAIYEAYRDSYDTNYGGFGDAPKFPRPSVFNFLFRYFKRTDTGLARDIALETLGKMFSGGMYDHLGGGFHRYSVDTFWRVPHFEKMLYDQGQIANSYLDAYQVTGDDFYGNVVRDILEYVLRDMASPEGGFYSAEDADSAPEPSDPDHKIEGTFYLWTVEELEAVLGKEKGKIFAAAYGVAPEGNTISDPHGEFGNRNVLYLAYGVDSLVKRFKKTETEIATILASSKRKLFAHREKRLRPLRDDKIITAWNGLMISAFARTGFILDEQKYTQAAQKAADFVLENLRDEKTNALRRRYRNGEARYPGHLDDYAFLLNGLLDVYEASARISYLQDSENLATEMVNRFADEKNGGFYDSAGESKELLFRSKELYDGAEPSGNAMAILALLRLGRMLDHENFLATAENALKATTGNISRAPSAFPQLAAAVDFARAKSMQIIIAGKPDAKDTKALLNEIRSEYLPNRVLLYADGADGQNWLAGKMEVVGSMAPLDGRAAAYVCENFTCELPTSDPKALAELVDRSK